MRIRSRRAVTAATTVALLCVAVFAITSSSVHRSTPSHTRARSSSSSTSGEGTTSTTWDGGPDGLPDCIPVDSRSTSDVGCELKTDFVAATPDPNLPGVPVYDDKGQAPGAIVGYIVPGIDQFVPLSLTNDAATLDRLKVCNQELMTQAALGDGCVALLKAMGTQPGFLPHQDPAPTTVPQ
jgi:hypothetical protein